MHLTTLILTTSMYASQVPEPSANEVKKVLNHYYRGSRPILAEVVACKTIEKKDKDTRNDCIETYSDAGQKGDLVYVYMTAMVPKGQKANLMVQASHNDVVRATKDVSMTSKWFRARAWRAFRLSKAGRWTFKVLDESGQPLKVMNIEVSEASD